MVLWFIKVLPIVISFFHKDYLFCEAFFFSIYNDFVFADSIE